LLTLLCLAAASSALRRGSRKAASDSSIILRRRRDRRRRAPAFTFTSRTDSNAGPCADYMGRVMPVYIPLWCTADAHNLKFTSYAMGVNLPRLRLSIDGIDKGYVDYPILQKTKHWHVSHDHLAAGLHFVKYSGDRLELRYVEVSGFGGSCSFDTMAGFDLGSFQNAGLDVVTRVVGPNRNFSNLNKRQLHFVSETLGTNPDKSIASTVVTDAMWGWMFRYSQEQNPGDEWFYRKDVLGKMYAEADKPRLNVSLDELEGFQGNMTLLEACNTVSNIAFQQAAVWMSCRGHPFPREEMANLVMSLNVMGAGSVFFHASGTEAGRQGDVVPIDIFMGQVYQIMVKDTVQRSRDLSDTERSTVLFLRSRPAAAYGTELTQLLGGPYNMTSWYSGVRALNGAMVSYDIWGVAIILACVEALDGKWPLPGIGVLVKAAVAVIQEILPSLVDGAEVDYLFGTARPAIRKLYKEKQLCRTAALDVIVKMAKFMITFVEAFIFQEQKIPVPKPIRDLFAIFDLLGISSDLLSDMGPAWNYYNGEEAMCNLRSSHGVWHEKCAHAMIHVTDLAALMIANTKCGLLGLPI